MKRTTTDTNNTSSARSFGKWVALVAAAPLSLMAVPAAAVEFAPQSVTPMYAADVAAQFDESSEMTQRRGNRGQYRGGTRGGSGGGYGGGYRGSYQGGHRGNYRPAYRGWNRGWRSNPRYNWRAHRNQYRSRYQRPRYYSPRRGYGYNRLNIGYALPNVYWGSNYYISNPTYYSLPPVYDNYRWVRYYNDAVLVDTYNGQVSDCVYDMFY